MRFDVPTENVTMQHHWTCLPGQPRPGLLSLAGDSLASRAGRSFSLGMTLMLAAVATACAQGYPSKPIRLVIPFAAGSATDVVGRLLGQALGDRMKQAWVVENRAGAGGAIAAEFTAQQSSDGYTLMLGTVSTHTLNPFVLKKIGYDPIRDFTPVAGIGGFPFAVVVNAGHPAKTLAEFIAFSKANPGKLAYGAPGQSQLICAETLRLRAGLDLAQVQYKSAVQAIAELIGGQITMVCSDFATAIAQIRGGKIRALAVSTEKRARELPEVATVRETFADFPEIRSWIGMLGPAGLAPKTVEVLQRETLAVTAMPEFQTKLAEFGFELLPLNAVQLGAFMKAELARWEKLIRQSGIEAQ